MDIYFDCEFNKLTSFFDNDPGVLISIGCIADNGDTFYAESESALTLELSEFVIEVVEPLLDGGDYLMPYSAIAANLKAWIESFDVEVYLLTDSPTFDFPHVKHMFENYGWPSNLNREPKHISHPLLDDTVDEIFREQGYRSHHALDDAIVNKMACEKITNGNSLNGKLEF